MEDEVVGGEQGVKRVLSIAENGVDNRRALFITGRSYRGELDLDLEVVNQGAEAGS
jgi:hypothetical protein